MARMMRFVRLIGCSCYLIVGSRRQYGSRLLSRAHYSKSSRHGQVRVASNLLECRFYARAVEGRGFVGTYVPLTPASGAPLGVAPWHGLCSALVCAQPFAQLRRNAAPRTAALAVGSGLADR